MDIDQHRYDINYILHMGNDDQQSLFKIWDSDRHMDSRLLGFASEIVIFGAPMGDLLPPELHIGKTSMAARFFGKNWRSGFNKEVQKPQLISDAYERAYDGEPCHDHIVVRKSGIICTYDRLVLPFKEGKRGAPMLISLSSLVRLERENNQTPNLQNHHDPAPPSSSPILLGSASPPNSKR